MSPFLPRLIFNSMTVILLLPECCFFLLFNVAKGPFLKKKNLSFLLVSVNRLSENVRGGLHYPSLKVDCTFDGWCVCVCVWSCMHLSFAVEVVVVAAACVSLCLHTSALTHSCVGAKIIELVWLSEMTEVAQKCGYN